MAIQKDDSSTNSNLVLKIDNGDLQALNSVLSKYRFINEEALIRYALVALLESEDNRLYAKKNNETVALRPNENLIRPDDTSVS